MPGKIESVPFLSQVEDVDKYLLEYRTLKVTSTSSSFQPHNVNPHHLNAQIRYNQSNTSSGPDSRSNESSIAVKTGVYGKPMPLGIYSNNTNSGTFNINNNNNNNNDDDDDDNINKSANGMNGTTLAGSTTNVNRKKFMGSGSQSYRFNGSGMKYNSQFQPHKQQQQQQQQPTQSTTNAIITNHFKQVYPQMNYNANSGSNLSLDQLSTPFLVSNQLPQQPTQVQQHPPAYPSSASSPSPAPPRTDTALSGSSSISSYTSNLDYVMPSSNGNFVAQFPSSQAQFPNYLDTGIISSTSIMAGGNSSGTANANLTSLASSDVASRFSSGSLVSEVSKSTPTSLGFDPSMSTPAIISESVIMEPTGSLIEENNLEASSVSVNKTSGQLLMNDYSVGWGSNHANASSNASGGFGIWNNDMSVWS